MASRGKTKRYLEMDAIQYVHEQLGSAKELPEFRAGDNVEVSYRIIEGDKERIQVFRGDVLQIKGTGLTKTFTVRKISNGVGVERIFPFHSPNIAELRVTKRGHVRRARLFYLRDRIGKKARIKERRYIKDDQ
jgi:large subunit ribosomal protein L19